MLARIGRVIALLFLLWITGLGLAGLGILPAGFLPLGGAIGGQAAPPVIAPAARGAVPALTSASGGPVSAASGSITGALIGSPLCPLTGPVHRPASRAPHGTRTPLVASHGSTTRTGAGTGSSGGSSHSTTPVTSGQPATGAPAASTTGAATGAGSSRPARPELGLGLGIRTGSGSGGQTDGQTAPGADGQTVQSGPQHSRRDGTRQLERGARTDEDPHGNRDVAGTVRLSPRPDRHARQRPWQQQLTNPHPRRQPRTTARSRQPSRRLPARARVLAGFASRRGSGTRPATGACSRSASS